MVIHSIARNAVNILDHLPAIRAAGTYDIKAVYSRSKKSAETLITDGSVDIYSDDSGPGKGLEDLLARKDIQAVDVVLPISHQPEVIKKALKAGKHVVSSPLQRYQVNWKDFRETGGANNCASGGSHRFLQISALAPTTLVSCRTIPVQRCV
jgi:homoserine dehydrogenase